MARLLLTFLFALTGPAAVVRVVAYAQEEDAPKESCSSDGSAASEELGNVASNGSDTSKGGDKEGDKGEYEPPDYDSVQKMSDFILPPLQPGELDLLRWKDTESPVQDFAGRIGLPERTSRVLRKYASDLGMFEYARRVHYDEPCPHDDGRFFATPGAYSGGKPLNWFAQRPSSQYVSDLHWYGCGDERTHESFLRALAEAGFDEVMKAIGERYDLDGLAIQGVGFLGATHATDGYMHYDWSDVDGKAFNVLIPLEQIPGAGPELYLEDDDRTGAIKLHPTYGLLLGEDTMHGTANCDHRQSGKVRMSVTIYLADVTEDNLEVVADDPTSMFPLPGATDWLWTQRGRHWGPGGKSSMAEDLGRTAFRPKDTLSTCPNIARHGRCDKNGNWRELHRWRMKCPVSCGVYMTDEEYKPGTPRKDIFY